MTDPLKDLEARAEEYRKIILTELFMAGIPNIPGLEQVATAAIVPSFIYASRAQHEITRKATIDEVLGMLRSEEASSYAFSMLETKKCSENDAHLTRHDWAAWLESKLKGEG